jgi:hypothetical protein
MQIRSSRKKETDRAVSESIGFILVFGIIITGIGLVTLYGYPMLLQQQSNSDKQIMEKNMIVLQNDLKSLAFKTVPYKETSLKVGGGALTVYNMSDSTGAKFSIYGDNADTFTCIKNDAENCATDPSSALTFRPGDMRYESLSAQTGMSLENGAVVERMLAQEGSVMLAQPRWFYDDQTNTAVIYLIGFNTTGINTLSQTGIGTVKMELDQTKTNSTQYPIPAGDNIYVTYTPNANADYSAAWENYFENTLHMTDPTHTGTYTFTPEPVRLVINRYEIRIISV